MEKSKWSGKRKRMKKNSKKKENKKNVEERKWKWEESMVWSRLCASRGFVVDQTHEDLS